MAPASYLHVPKLGKSLVAVVESADEWLETLVRLFVGPDVSALGEKLAADAARVGLFASVAAHVCLCGQGRQQPICEACRGAAVP